jgi:pimeloyl-ACP methyl ester carboxylesterase
LSRSSVRAVLLGLAAAVTALAGAAWAQPDANPYAKPGPFVSRGYSGPVCMVFRPVELKPGAPIILWGNGTGTQPVDYQALLNHLASYGFVVGAANTPNAGSGAEMLACLDWLAKENAREGSVYKDKLDLSKVGATGHSQGGRGALMAGHDPRVSTIAPLMPAARNADPAAVVGPLHGPMLLLSGGADVMAPPETSQKPLFEAAKVPVVWLTERDAGHLAAMRDGGPYSAAVTAWFLYRLDGDQKAAAMFQGERCGYCGAPDWTVQRKGGD